MSTHSIEKQVYACFIDGLLINQAIAFKEFSIDKHSSNYLLLALVHGNIEQAQYGLMACFNFIIMPILTSIFTSQICGAQMYNMEKKSSPRYGIKSL